MSNQADKTYAALYVYGAEFQMISYHNKDEAINEMKVHFDSLIETNQFDSENDEGFVFETMGDKKDMEIIFATRNNEKYGMS